MTDKNSLAACFKTESFYTNTLLRILENIQKLGKQMDIGPKHNAICASLSEPGGVIEQIRDSKGDVHKISEALSNDILNGDLNTSTVHFMNSFTECFIHWVQADNPDLGRKNIQGHLKDFSILMRKDVIPGDHLNNTRQLNDLEQEQEVFTLACLENIKDPTPLRTPNI